jgi:hypothetical protein
MSFAAGPHFMEEKSARALCRSVYVIGQATVFFACGAYQSAEFGFQERFLALPGTQLHDERHGVFREFCARSWAGFL